MSRKQLRRIEDWDELTSAMHMKNSSQEEIARVIHEFYIMSPLTRAEFTESWKITEDLFSEILDITNEEGQDEARDD